MTAYPCDHIAEIRIAHHSVPVTIEDAAQWDVGLALSPEWFLAGRRFNDDNLLGKEVAHYKRTSWSDDDGTPYQIIIVYWPWSYRHVGSEDQ